MIVLETPRLYLRWFRQEDASFVLELLNDPAWLQNIGDRQVRSIEDARSKIVKEWLPGYWRDGFGSWVIQDKKKNEAMGVCGLFHRKHWSYLDLGYALLPRFYGHGFATEAAAATLDYAREVLGISRIIAFTSPDNRRSQHLLERVGMRFEDQRRIAFSDEDRESYIYGWGTSSNEGQENTLVTIDNLVHRFFAAFCTQHRSRSNLAAIPYFCIPEAQFIKVRGVERKISNLPDFILPRIHLLHSDEGINFSEVEIEAKTEISGNIAQRWLRYQKSWSSKNQVCFEQGHKSMQFLRTVRGWKIATLVWCDD